MKTSHLTKPTEWQRIGNQIVGETLCEIQAMRVDKLRSTSI